MERQTFDKRAVEIKQTLAHYKGILPSGAAKTDSLLSATQVKENLLLDMKDAVRQMDALRTGTQNVRSVDINLASFVQDKFGFGSVDGFYDALGVDPSAHSMQNLMSMPDFEEGYRWLVPEIVREAVRLGLRRNPIYPALIAAEESVTGLKVTMPQVNMSDATPEYVNEAETIPVGTVSFAEKDVKIRKIGTGIKLSDEVQQYVPLNILSLYLQDAGVKLGLGMDTMAVDVLLNGEAGSVGQAAPVIGVESTTDGVTYFDLLRAWIRMGRLGRIPSGIISSEKEALKILLLDEFLRSPNGAAPRTNLNVRTPIPQSQDYLIHGAMPSGDKLGIYDNTSALIKLNAGALKVESERIAERQVTGTFVTVTTGFAKLFRDAFIVLDGTLAFSSYGFPSYMDVSVAEGVVIK